MEKKLALFISKLQEVNNGQLKKGFATLKNLRGGVLPSTNDAYPCTNSGTCTGTNSNDCDNTGTCTNTTNKKRCSNPTTCVI